MKATKPKFLLKRLLSLIAILNLAAGATMVANAADLFNGDLDNIAVGPQVNASPVGWAIVATKTISGPFNDGADSESWCNVQQPGGYGLFFKPFQGSINANPALDDLISVYFYQDNPSTPGTKYTLCGYASCEPNFCCLLPAPPGQNLPQALFVVEFLDSADNVIANNEFDLVAGGMHNDGPNDMGLLVTPQYTAPAGTVKVRVGATMRNAYNTTGAQSFFVDALSVVACGSTPPTNCLQIQCSTNKTIPCTSNLVFDLPTVVSICCGTNYSISVFGSDVTSNAGICSMSSTRTWLITNCSGSSNFCSQTITVAPATSYTITLQPGYNLIANQLNDGNNSAGILFPNTGQRDGDELFLYNLTTNCLGVFTGYFFDSSSSGGFDDQNGNQTSAPTLSPGMGAFYVNNSQAPETVTFTGTPNCTNPPPPLTCPCGTLYLWSRSVDCYGTFENVTGLIPQEGAEVLRWNGNGYTAYTFTGGGWTPITPVLNVGEAAFFMIPCPTNPCITLTCTTNKSVPCTANWSFDPPTNVADHCCAINSLTITTVTNSTACSSAITRTWLYTDVCGHSNLCSQTVTLTGCCTNGSCCGTNAGARMIKWIQCPLSGPPVLLPNPSGGNAAGTWIITNLPCYGNVLVTQTFPDNNPPADGAYWSFWYLATLLTSAPGPYGSFDFVEPGYGPYSWVAFNSLFAFYSANPVSYQVNFYFLNGPPNPCTLYLGVAGLGSASAATVSQPVVFRTEYDQLANGSASAPSANMALNGIYGPAVAGSVGTVVGSAFSLNHFGSLVDTGVGVFQPTNAVALVTLPSGSGLDMNGNAYPAVGTYPSLSLTVNQAAYDGLGFTIGYVCCTNTTTNCIQVVCSSDKTVPCGSNWNFDAPTNIVDTCCTNYSVSFTTVTNSSPCPWAATRTWTIADPCGNSNSCSQTVVVVVAGPPITPVIVGLHTDAAGVHIIIQTQPCYTYALERKDSLSPTVSWSICQTITGDGTNHEFLDPPPLPATRFYRVRVICP